jgi:hypothetical protein
MGDDALMPSLSAQVRTLQDILPHLLASVRAAEAEAVRARAQAEENAAQIRNVTRLAQIALQPEAEEVRASPPHRHAKPRDRHGLRVIPGGMAALTPVALLGHGGLGPAVISSAWRWFWHGSARSHLIAAGMILTVGTATAAPVAVTGPDTDAPHPHAVTGMHHHRHGLVPPLPDTGPGR